MKNYSSVQRNAVTLILDHHSLDKIGAESRNRIIRTFIYKTLGDIQVEELKKLEILYGLALSDTQSLRPNS